MNSTNEREKIEEVWLQQLIPVIYRGGKGHPLLLRLPYKADNYDWLRNDRPRKPRWISDKKYWEIPMARFNDTINRSLVRWKAIYIIQPYRHQEKCAPACWNATGHECECSCMGENHGSQSSGGDWYVVSDTFATKWGAKELACRLLCANKKS
jgi:hypothetical protein